MAVDVEGAHCQLQLHLWLMCAWIVYSAVRGGTQLPGLLDQAVICRQSLRAALGVWHAPTARSVSRLSCGEPLKRRGLQRGLLQLAR